MNREPTRFRGHDEVGTEDMHFHESGTPRTVSTLDLVGDGEATGPVNSLPIERFQSFDQPFARLPRSSERACTDDDHRNFHCGNRASESAGQSGGLYVTPRRFRPVCHANS